MVVGTTSLRANGDWPSRTRSGRRRAIWVNPPGTAGPRVRGLDDDINSYPAFIRDNPIESSTSRTSSEGLRPGADLQDRDFLHLMHRRA